MPEADRRLLAAAARVVLGGDLGELAPQLDRPAPWLYPEQSCCRCGGAPCLPSRHRAPVAVPPLVMENGIGGFTPDGREYVVVLEGDRETPLPWSNVLANPDFGTMVSASGSAFTWAENSRENRLTPFANDPVADPTGEAIFLRDDDSGAVWGATPGPLPRRADAGRWVVRHAAGATRYQHATAGLEQELAVFVAPDDPVKLAVLTLTNTSTADAAPQRVRLRRMVPGPAACRRTAIRDDRARRGDRRDLRAEPLQHGVRRPRQLLAAPPRAPRSFTCDRADFVGRNRTLARPAGLFRERLGRTQRRRPRSLRGASARGARSTPGATRRVAFVLGQGRDAAHAAALAARYASLAHVDAGVRERRARVGRDARRRAGAGHPTTPSTSS